jgi:hypothetical protein
VSAVDYEAPLAIRAVTVAVFAATGLAVAWAFQALLEEPIWTVSTGLGSVFGALVRAALAAAPAAPAAAATAPAAAPV